MQHAVSIELFGGLRVRCGTQVIDRFRSQKTAALLAYLACHGRMHQREKLADLFWPEATPQAARASLCTALSSLRSQFDPMGTGSGSLLYSDRNTIGLPHGISTDLGAITDLLDRADYIGLDKEKIDTVISLRRQAIQMFRDDLLAGMYEPWVTEVQERLHSRVADALIFLAGVALHRSETPLANAYVQRALDLNPACSLPQPLQKLLLATGDEFQEVTKKTVNPLRTAPTRVHRKAKPRSKPVRRLSVSFTDTSVASAQMRSGTMSPPQTKMFGRRTEFAHLCELLSDSSVRLVTLTGMGGIGKTRLAWATLQAMDSLRSGCQAFFISAAGTDDARYLPDRLAEACGLSIDRDNDDKDPSGGTDSSPQLFDRILHHLAAMSRPILLVLDNFETVIHGGDTFVQALLAASPSICCLVTSRTPLHVDGEIEVPIAPLPVPPLESSAQVTSLLEKNGGLQIVLDNWPSVALFVHRARRAVADFSLSTHNAAAIQTLVNKLEGIPLAIELAAARAQSFTPAQMIEELDRRLDFLVSRQRLLRPSDRHASLKLTISWSYGMLQPEWQQLLRAVAIFRDGCRFEALTVVVPFEESQLRTGLDALCDSSLLLRESDGNDGDETRYRLLDTIRDFVEAEITLEEQVELRQRHTSYYVRLAEMAEPHLQDRTAPIWLRHLDQEQANFRRALDWSCTTRGTLAAESAIRLASSLHRFWLIRGRVQEGRDWLRASLAHPDGGKWGPVREATARNRAGILAMDAGDDREAEEHYQETLAMRRASGDRRGIASTLNNLGILASRQGRLQEAYTWYEESLAIWREMGHDRYVAVVLANLGAIANDMGRLEDAMGYLAESIPLAKSNGDNRGAAISLRNWGEVAFKRGDLETAESLFLESVGVFNQLDDVYSMAYSLFGLGAIAWRRRQERRSRRLLTAAIQAFAAFGLPLPEFCNQEIRQIQQEGLDISVSTVPGTDGTPMSIRNASQNDSLHAIKVLAQVVLDSWEESYPATSGSDITETPVRSFVSMLPPIKGE